MWYGKDPGVDRAGDALKHANYSGSSENGGVIAVFGDDHPGKSSTIAHQSEQALMSFCMPVLYPASVQEYIDYALAGWAMSRYSGLWVGFKAVNETVESTASIDVDPTRHQFVTPEGGELPPNGIHVALRYAPQEDDLLVQRYRIPRAIAFARANNIDKVTVTADKGLGVVAAGKAYLDVMDALYVLGIDENKAKSIGLSVYKVGMVWPLEPAGLRDFARGKDELLFVEEKRAFMEPQAAHMLFNLPAGERPRIVGKTDETGIEMMPSDMQLNTGMVAQVIAARLETLGLADEGIRARARTIKEDIEQAAVSSGTALVRTPFFCSGCPHNRSTKVPEGSVALNGIGCHGMAAIIHDHNIPPTQMGAEGATWIGASHFSNMPHAFQNLGDGTYTHSGILAVRAAIAADTNITYKILYNDAVAMTGGQPAEGNLTVDQISRQLAAEGVKGIAVVSDEPEKYGRGYQFDSRVTIYNRRDLDKVQRDFRERKGVTAIIYDQTCAAEKRRRRKRGLFPDPSRRAYINERVCEGCGDCSVQANCVSIQPLDTELGRKRVIDQSSCNKDFSCIEGFCPSFVTVEGGQPRRSLATELPEELLRSLPMPGLRPANDNYGILINGIGGTGVVTIGAIIGMAAHLEGKQCSIYDMTGLSQKGGAVFSHVKVGPVPQLGSTPALTSPKIAAGDADLVLGCDLVVSSGAECLSATRSGKTSAIINGHLVPTGAFQLNPDLDLAVAPMHANIDMRLGDDKVNRVDATGLAMAMLGDSIGSNMMMVGYAAQKGLLPVSVESIENALDMNGVAVDLNRKAFTVGRLAAHDPGALSDLIDGASGQDADEQDSLPAFIARRVEDLTAYQNAAYAKRYADLVARVAAREQAAVPGSTKLQRAVARYLFKLMAYKDEYEVARLQTDGELVAAIAGKFEGKYNLHFYLAPPILAGKDPLTGIPRKREYGPWMYGLLKRLAGFKGLRGTPLDIFGYTAERRMERKLRDDYISMLGDIGDKLSAENIELAVQLTEIPERIRGFGPVKQQHVTRAKAIEADLLGQWHAGAGARKSPANAATESA
jgi:indolepyruvate ferredoxin oxidoreductase